MTGNKTPHISVDNVLFRYADNTVLDHISLNIDENEFCLLIGPNGGGKTTLIKLIIGVLTPKAGSITLKGRSVLSSRKTIGYVPQSLQFDPQFPISVGEFVMLGALSKLTLLGRWPASVRQKARKLLEEVELGGFFDRAFGSLSGGQKQRATLMRALMTDPEILILDEPINNLDAKSSDLFYSMLKKLKGKKTILMITHLMGELFSEADSIYVVNHNLEQIDKEHACGHYQMGLYHRNKGDE